jgi:raffinose/stachyose/melibiose transport system permease protein
MSVQSVARPQEGATTSPASPEPAPVKRGRAGRRRRFEWGFLALAVPALVIYVGFLAGPVLASFTYSFTRWDGINAPVFTGLDNFVRLAADRDYAAALLHTVAFAAVILVGQSACGLGLALLLNRARRGVAVLRAIFFAPALLSTAVIALVWGFIYNALVGVTPVLARLLGVEDGPLADVLGNSSTAIWAVSAAVIWQYGGYIMVIYLAGLKDIPVEVYEASDLDGATGWRRFRSITWPLLLPSTSVVLTISLAGNLKLFDQVFLLTGGGPAGATETAAISIYRTAFGSSDYGYSATQSVVLTILTLIVVVFQRWLSARGSK